LTPVTHGERAERNAAQLFEKCARSTAHLSAFILAPAKKHTPEGTVIDQDKKAQAEAIIREAVASEVGRQIKPLVETYSGSIAALIALIGALHESGALDGAAARKAISGQLEKGGSDLQRSGAGVYLRALLQGTEEHFPTLRETRRKH
jgi:hypothetical protein